MVCSQGGSDPHQLARCAAEYRGRLGDDPGLSREAVLRAATIDAAYELHQDEAIGSLEVGKFADLIVLDRNPLQIPARTSQTLKCSKPLSEAMLCTTPSPPRTNNG